MTERGTPVSEPVVRHEDDDLAVISKPAGLTVHPGAGRPTGTLLDWLDTAVPATRRLDRHGLVHRLDRDTSGLLIIAKTDDAARDLSAQFQGRHVRKWYRALVEGTPAKPAAEIDAPIARHHADRKRYAVRPDGKPASTTYRTVHAYPGRTLLEVEPKTGRTHQIRVHLAALRHPIVGDAVYGTADPELGRHFLHAAKLRFTHPRTKRSLTVDDPLPDDLKAFLRELDQHAQESNPST